MASIKRIIEKTWLAVFVVLALIFVFFFFKNEKDTMVKMFRADARLLGTAAIAQILYFCATVLTWQKVLSFTTHKTVNFLEGLSQILLVNFGKYIPGKIWGLAARGARLRELGYRLEEISSVSYLEQFLLLLSGFWLAFFAAAIVYSKPIYVLFLVLTTLVIVLFRHGNNLAAKVARVIPKAGLLEHLFGMDIGNVRLFALTAGYMAIWLFLTLSFVMLCSSLTNIELTTFNIAVQLLSVTAGFLAGFLAIFAPGGVGVREGVGAALLTTIVTLEEAVMLMLLFRVWVILWELAVGSAVLANRLYRARIRASDRIGE